MPPKGTKTVASNRKARHDYEILDTFEAGIVLTGSEVKSLRNAQAQMKDSYARIEHGEMYLVGLHIAPYQHASSQGGHDPDQTRKLLLNRREIDEIEQRLKGEPLTVIPLAMYFSKGRAKVEIALARGKRKHDKRQDIARRDAQRDIDRAMSHRHR